jgi:secreted Zn-dependent insulinase-like peptidase
LLQILDTAGKGEGEWRVLSVQVASLSTPPELLVDSPGLRVWHKLDTTFRIPKASAYFRVSPQNKYVLKSVKHTDGDSF